MISSKTKHETVLFISALLLSVIWLPINSLLGWIEFSSPKFSLNELLWVPIFVLGLHAVVVAPIHNLSMDQLSLWTQKKRLFVLTALSGAPLFGFAFYRGGIYHSGDLLGHLMIAFPAALSGACLYERSRKAWVFTLTLFVWAFPWLFLFNDGLASFPVPILYYLKGAGAEVLRVTTPLLACVYLWRRSINPKSTR